MAVRWIATMLSLVFVIGLTGCREEGTLEKAGREVDEAVDDAADAVEESAEEAREETEEALE